MAIVSFFALLLLFLGYQHWHSLMHNLSRFYETAFVIYHYDYKKIGEKGFSFQGSKNHKILVDETYATPKMVEFLEKIDQVQKRLIWARRGSVTEELYVDGIHVVVKTHTIHGVLTNLLFMSRGVGIWNNAQMAREKNIPVMKPIAFVEWRTPTSCKSSIVYLYEGKVCEEEFRAGRPIIHKVEEMCDYLLKNRIVHHDFRLRNMVIYEDDHISFIDIDKIHWYPNNSYVFRRRMKREVNKFNQNIEESMNSSERLHSRQVLGAL